MELKLYLNIIFKRFWLIILLPALCCILSAFISLYLLVPMYESSTTIYVISKNSASGSSIAYEDLLVNRQLVEDYRELIKSRSITNAVIEQLNLTDLNSEILAKRVNVQLINDTRLLEIRVQDPNPVRARNIAEKLSSIFINKISALLNIRNIDIVDAPEVPDYPIKPRVVINVLTAFCLGLILALIITIFIDYLNDTIRTKEDVEDHLGLTVLSTIPRFDIK